MESSQEPTRSDRNEAAQTTSPLYQFIAGDGTIFVGTKEEWRTDADERRH